MVCGWILLVISCIMGYFTVGLQTFLGEMRILVIILICPLVLLTVIYAKPVYRILSTKAFVFLGKISMSVYLWHTFFRYILGFTVWDNTLAGLVIYFVCTMTMSVFSHLFIEKELNVGIRKIVMYAFCRENLDENNSVA